MTQLISKLISVHVCVYLMITRVREYGSYLKRMSCPVTCSLYLIIVVLLFDTLKNNPNGRRHSGKKREGSYIQKWKQIIRTRWWQSIRGRSQNQMLASQGNRDCRGRWRWRGKNRAWQVCLPCVLHSVRFRVYISLPRNVIFCIKFPWIQPNQKRWCSFYFSFRKIILVMGQERNVLLSREGRIWRKGNREGYAISY